MRRGRSLVLSDQVQIGVPAMQLFDLVQRRLRVSGFAEHAACWVA